MSNSHHVEYTDTFGGEANYSWVQRHTVTMPELTHYGYDGGHGYTRANRTYMRELMKKAKAACGLTGVRGRVESGCGATYFYPYLSNTVLIIED